MVQRQARKDSEREQRLHKRKGKGLLRDRLITPGALKRYYYMAHRLLLWLHCLGISAAGVHDMDSAVAEYVEALYIDGGINFA